MIVIKFGGSLLRSTEYIKACAQEVVKQTDRDPIVVVSALNGVTDMLIENAYYALNEKADPSDIRRIHLRTVEALGFPAELIERLLFDVEVLLRGIQQVGELSVRVFDRLLSYGERLSSVIFAQALREEGLPAYAVTAYDIGFLTDSNHTEATPLNGIEKGIRRELSNRRGLPVITGFIGKDGEGNITTIGRNGSDLTASIIASAMDAEELQIYTDTEGLMSADPHIQPDAVRIGSLTYQEAAELAYFGATLLHPKTLIPVMAESIPIRLRPLHHPEKETIIEHKKNSQMPVIAHREHIALINIRTHRLSPILNDMRIFSRLMDELELNPIAITNTLSTCTVAVEEAPFRKRIDYRIKGFWIHFPSEKGQLLQEKFRALKEILSERAHTELVQKTALLCIVSETLKDDDYLAHSVLRLLQEAGIRVHIFWTTSSRLALMLAINTQDVPSAVHTLHSFLVQYHDRTCK